MHELPEAPVASATWTSRYWSPEVANVWPPNCRGAGVSCDFSLVCISVGIFGKLITAVQIVNRFTNRSAKIRSRMRSRSAH